MVLCVGPVGPVGPHPYMRHEKHFYFFPVLGSDCHFTCKEHKALQKYVYYLYRLQSSCTGLSDTFTDIISNHILESTYTVVYINQSTMPLLLTTVPPTVSELHLQTHLASRRYIR